MKRSEYRRFQVTDRVCGTCRWRWHKRDKDESGNEVWVCTCGDSENWSDWTEYSDTCEEWRKR